MIGLNFQEIILFKNFIFFFRNIQFSAKKMGFASASREEKFKMMRTNKSKKAVKRLNKMGKKGKVNKKIIGQLTEVKKKKAHKSLQRARDVSFILRL